MTSYIKARNSLILLLFTLILSACQSVDIRGQYISDKAISEINDNNFDQYQVADLLGNPSFVPEYSKNTWYYIQRSQTKRAWFDPQVVEQRIVKITFDQEGIARNAELIKGGHIDQIAPKSDKTPTPGTEASGVQKFVKNIGRFTKSSKKKGRGN